MGGGGGGPLEHGGLSGVEVVVEDVHVAKGVADHRGDEDGRLVLEQEGQHLGAVTPHSSAEPRLST